MSPHKMSNIFKVLFLISHFLYATNGLAGAQRNAIQTVCAELLGHFAYHNQPHVRDLIEVNDGKGICGAVCLVNIVRSAQVLFGNTANISDPNLGRIHTTTNPIHSPK